MDAIVSPVKTGAGIDGEIVQPMAPCAPLVTTLRGGKGIETDEPMHHHGEIDSLAPRIRTLE
jgi:hypothetical protein